MGFWAAAAGLSLNESAGAVTNLKKFPLFCFPAYPRKEVRSGQSHYTERKR